MGTWEPETNTNTGFSPQNAAARDAAAAGLLHQDPLGCSSAMVQGLRAAHCLAQRVLSEYTLREQGTRGLLGTWLRAAQSAKQNDGLEDSVSTQTHLQAELAPPGTSLLGLHPPAGLWADQEPPCTRDGEEPVPWRMGQKAELLLPPSSTGPTPRGLQGSAEDSPPHLGPGTQSELGTPAAEGHAEADALRRAGLWRGRRRAEGGGQAGYGQEASGLGAHSGASVGRAVPLE